MRRKKYILGFIFLLNLFLLYSCNEDKKFVEKAKENLQENRQEQALVYFNKALEINPKNKEALNGKGEILLNNSEKIEEALNCFERTLIIDPDNIEAWNGKGLCLFFTLKIEQSLECFNTSLDKDPNNINALLNKTLIFRMQNEHEKVIDCFTKVISLIPDNFIMRITNITIEILKKEEAKIDTDKLKPLLNKDFTEEELTKKLEELKFEGFDIYSIEKYAESEQKKLFHYLDNYIIELCEKAEYRISEDVCNKLLAIINEKIYISDYTILTLTINKFENIDKLKPLLNEKFSKKDLENKLLELGYKEDEINQILNEISSNKASYKTHFLSLQLYIKEKELENIKEKRYEIQRQIEMFKNN